MQRLSQRRRGHWLAACLPVVVWIGSASAQNSTWLNTGADFNSGGNWNNGIPSGIATFTGIPAAQPNLSSGATVTHLDFQSGGWTFTGSRIVTSTGILSTGSPTGLITFNNSYGVGASNTWTNSVDVIINGVLDTAAGSGTSRQITFNGTGLVTIAGGLAAIGSGASITTRQVQLDGTGNVTINSEINNGSVSGAVGSLRTRSSGLISLTGVNTYTGTNTLGGFGSNAGTVAINSDRSFGAVPLTAGANILVNDNSPGVNLRLIDGSGAVTLHANRNIVVGSGSGGRTLTFDVAGTADTLSVDGQISEGGATFGRLAKLGGGTLALNNANAYSGSSNFSAGTVAINHNSGVGSGPLVLSGAVVILSGNAPRTLNNELRVSGTHTVGGSQAFTFAGPIVHTGSTNRTINILNAGVTTYANTVTLTNSTNTGDRVWTFQSTGGELVFSQPIVNGPGGVGSVTFSKQGLTTINGNNTYTGLTTINNGTVRMNGTHSPAGAYTVNSGTLAGGGTIASSVTVTDDAFISPGNSVGTMRAASFDLQPESTYVVDVNFNEIGPSEADKLIAIGPSAAVTLGDGVNFPAIQFAFAYSGAIGVPQTFIIIQNDAPTDTTTGQFAGAGQGQTIVDGARTYSFDYAAGDGNDVAVTFTAVPEPSAVMLSAMLVSAGRRRRR